MTELSSAELNAMRNVADDFFPDTCTIQTVTRTAGATGGITESWANTYTSVKCRLDPRGGAEGVSSDAVEAIGTWTLNIPYDQAISVEDRVVHTSKTYEVTAVWDTHSYSTIRRATLKRVM